MKQFFTFFCLLIVTQGAWSQTPVNDDCANAILLNADGVTVASSNLNTLVDAANPTCGGTNAIKDVWYKFIYSGNNLVITTTLGTLTDTRMAVYNSCGGTQLVCNDDATGLGYASQITLGCNQLTYGATYYVQVGGYNSLQGEFGISLQSVEVSGCMDPNATNYNACASTDDGSCIIALQNEICATAVPLNADGIPVNTTNQDATVGPTPGCGGAIKDVWFSFVYQGGNLSISTQISSDTAGTDLVDTQMAIYNACGGSIIACDDDDGPGNYCLIKFGCPAGDGSAGTFEDDALVIGQTYYIQVGGYNSYMGTFSITLTSTTVSGCTNPFASNYATCATQDDGSCTFPPLQAQFDAIPLATAANCYTYQMINLSAGNQNGWIWEIPDASISSSTEQEPAFVFPGPGIYPASLIITDAMGNSDTTSHNLLVSESHQLTIDITADNLPQQTTWKVYNSSNQLIAQGASNDATLCINDECHRVDFFDSGNNGMCCNNGNGSYTLYLDGNPVATGGTFGNYTFENVNCPEGTSCENAITAVLDTLDVPQPNTWYTFTPSVNGQYKISTCGFANCNTVIWLYDYCNMANFDDSNQATYTYNDDLCNAQAEITPYLEGGVTYWIRVGDHNADCGTGSFQVLFEYLGPIQGCMDNMACNYSPLAEVPAPCYYNGDPNCNNIGPDLSVDGNLLFSSMYQTTIDGTDACLVNEGCLQGLGNREILRFSTRIDNVGNQDYYIGTPTAANPQFIWDLCHNHYHYAGYAEYLLFDDQGNPMPEVGFKNGFCVLDLGCITGLAKFGCGNMGITAGCYDVYSAGLQCQWVDITNVPAGTYHLVVRTNWDHDPDMLGHYELAYDNNWSQVCFSFERDSLDQLINFQKLPMSSCGIMTDCIGQPFGSVQPDCEGNCPGQVKKGDVYPDLMYDLSDINTYGNTAVNFNLTPNNCNDLNQDQDLSIADAAYLDFCIHQQQSLGILPGLMEPCSWDPEVIDPGQTAILSVMNLNTTDGYFDVAITNPDGEVNALQFDISGATILNVSSLLPNAQWMSYIYFQDEGTKIAAMGHFGTMIPVSQTPQPILRVHYANLTDNQICIGNIDEILSIFVHNILTQIGPCINVSDMIASADFATSACAGYPILFTDNSINTIDRTWLFPTGSPSVSYDPTVNVTFTTPGPQSFMLIVTDGIFSDTAFYNNVILIDNQVTYYLDADGDGYGDPQSFTQGCNVPAGYVSNNTDCNDVSSSISPTSMETCNNLDDNCNGTTDEGFDQDNDGISACNGDCDDTNSLTYPGALELCNNSDDDCNGIIDEGFDQDGDGTTSCNGDCNDTNPNIGPAATETCNGLDDNCNGSVDEGLSSPWYSDIDGDGYGAGVASYFCITPVGYSSNSADCNDADPTLNPSAVEVADNVDNDCDGFIDEGVSVAYYNLNEVNLSAMPNPAQNQCLISTKTFIGNVQVDVFNSSGQWIQQFQYNGTSYLLDISNWSSGVYQIVLKTHNGFGKIRLVKE